MTFFSDLLDLIRTLGYQVYDTDVPETPKFPYIVAWGGTANPHSEQPVSSRADGVSDRVGVTCAAGTPEGARIVHQRVRQLLQPGGFPTEIGGFLVKIRDHQAVQVDRGEMITGTNRHPAYAVDIYSVQR